MTIQSQLDQVLVLAEKMAGEKFDILRYSGDGTYMLRGSKAAIAFVGAAAGLMSKHGPAIRAAVGGEAVGWQYLDAADDEWRKALCPNVWRDADVPVRAIYASPPATVDVGALLELVKKWNGIPANNDIEFDSREWIAGYDKALNTCAIELAALIGEKA